MSKKFRAIISVCLAAIMALSSLTLLSACSSGENYDVYIYNGKGENAEAMNVLAKAYEQETGKIVKVFSIGSGQDAKETLRTAMATKKPPTIYTVQTLQELVEWKESDRALDLRYSTNSELKEMGEQVANNLRLTLDGEDNFGIPYGLEGYGLIVDKQMVADVFGEANVENFLRDFKTATYQEFETAVKGLQTYIKNGIATDVKLSGNTYTTNASKKGDAAKLEGVFSVAGSEAWTYGNHLVNVAMNTHFDTPLASSKATNAQIEDCNSSFRKYAKTLDLISGNACVDRGSQFVNSTTNGYDASVQNFATGKSMFIQQGNWAYKNITDVNPELKNGRLTFLPIKMDINQSDIDAPDMTVNKFNSSIPIYAPMYYTINASCTQKQIEDAQDFLVWLNKSETGKDFILNKFNFIPYGADSSTKVTNDLGNSILEYQTNHNNLGAPYLGVGETWSREMVGNYIMENYLVKTQWNVPDDYKTIATHSVESWIKLLQQ